MKTTSSHILALLLAAAAAISLAACSSSSSSVDNTYGSLDHSTASRGYITATAKDMTVDLILQGPDQAQTVLEIAPGETTEIAPTGPGKYQYAFASRAEDDETYCIRYKNSFDIDSFIN